MIRRLRFSPPLLTSLHDEHGYTLIELLVAMIVGIIVVMAGFALLQFTTEDVTHVTDRVHVDQLGRTALERIMLELHSTCVAENVIPIIAGSNENDIKFVSESGTGSAFTTVDKHEIIYTAATATTEGTLVEKTYQSTGQVTGSEGTEYTWSTTPAATTALLKGIKQTKYGAEAATPIFQYFRYYETGDAIPTGDTTIPYGELNPAPMTEEKLKATAGAKNVDKVTVSFTLAPEGKEGFGFNQDRAIVLEDSAIFRLTPSTEASTSHNLPCSEKI
jgi:type II secretory pathway component PulJ